MAFTKTVKQVGYNIEITKTLGVPQRLLENVKRLFLNEGMIPAIAELRLGFREHYGELMSLRDAKDIVEDMAKEYNLKKGIKTDTYPDQGPSLGEILSQALHKKG